MTKKLFATSRRNTVPAQASSRPRLVFREPQASAEAYFFEGCSSMKRSTGSTAWLGALARGAVTSILLMGLAACASVEPWERGNLAKPEMQLEPHPAQRALRDHVYGSREAAASGASAAGGGCGCY